ncbi:MAG: 4Fe-4S dicluster domain-containing protein [Chloroflexota bacterium]|nr:4Fe-4S dicluster domain-containing protein [Chloroflexota bacterium]
MATPEIVNLTTVKRDPTFVDRLSPDGRLLRRCIQCGTCTASCPAAPAMDISPRQMWRMVQLGLEEEVLRSKTMWLCSLCYQCQVRCPRGIPLTDTITRLKEMALKRQLAASRDSAGFYRAFTDVVRRYGRMREMEFMVRYFLATNLLNGLNYARMGLTLFSRGKARPEFPKLGGEGRLDKLFERVAELEKAQ